MENPAKKFAAGTFNVKFKIDFSGGISDSVTQVITVYPKGNLDFNAPDVCYNDQSKFTNTSSSAAGYLWDFGDNFTSNATSPDHLYATSGTYTVKLTATSLNGCKLSVSKSHTVKVRPDADIVTDDRCLGDTTSFLNGSLYAHSYAWNFGDGNGSTLKEPTHVYGSAGNYNVKLVATNNNGCVDSTTATAIVHALPVPNFTISNSCVSKDIVFNNTTTGAVSFAWNLGDGSSSATKSPVYQYANAGTYTISLLATSGFGCKNSITKTVDIYPKPKADFSTTNVCAGTSATFTNKSTISSGTVNYLWYFGDGSTSTQVSPSYTYASAGVYNVKLVATSVNGCSDSMTMSITIHTGAVANFTTGNACLGQKVNFTNTSNNANSYTWTFGDGNGSNTMSPTHTYNAIGNYTVTLMANNSNGCSSNISKTVQVNPVPTVNFTATNVCQGTATAFTNNSTISSGTITYSWDFGNGSTNTSVSPTHIYASAGNYNVILTATSNNACAASATRTVAVYSNPVSDFTTSDVCAGSGLQFVNHSSAGTYLWNFGNGGTSTAANPNYTYTNAGTYTVTLTVTNSNNCVAVSSKVVTVHALPVSDFTANTVCAGNATSFTNNSTGAISYNWQFGEGGSSVSANPSYVYPNAGTYTATLISTNSNGCKSQVSKSVTVNAVPVASFTSGDVCLGTAANFTNTSTGTGNTYSWLFGDGGSASTTNAIRTYASAGAYNVTLTAINGVGCSNVATKTVNVFTVPTAAFTTSDQCLGNNMVFTNQSVGAALYNWQFGDGTSSPLTNPVKGYSAVGAYNVTLTATNNNKCSSSITKVVNINPNPVASFTGTPICTSNTAQMNNTSTISSGAMTFSWNFGDGTTSTLSAPSHTFPAEGSYVVTLTASSGTGCQSTVQNTVSVAPVPTADFSANEVCLGGTTVFTNTSTGDATAAWTFGDATNSSLLSPVHTYAAAGTYNVGLSVTSKFGCVSSISKPVVVNPNPVAAFTASNACQGTPVSIVNNSVGATSYEWFYGFSGPDKTTTPNVILDNPGTTIIRLIAITNKGCRNETSRNVSVYTSPKAEFTVMKTCQGDQTLFVNKSLNAGSYNWQFGDGNNSGNNNPSHQYSAAGTYKVVLTANNAQCSNQYTMDVVVNPLPSADFTFNTSGKEVNFTSSNKTNVKAYDWNFGDGTFGNIADPKHLYNNAIVQVFNVCLNVTDNAGCQAEVCKNVSVNLLGKEEVEIVHSSVVVYPNPNRGQFNVFVSGSQDRAEVEVFNLVGVKVADAQNSGNDLYNVSATELSEGAYLVKVTFEGKTSVHRIMIAK
jgi:PKD repeat protein